MGTPEWLKLLALISSIAFLRELLLPTILYDMLPPAVDLERFRDEIEKRILQNHHT